jgi:hypothetical protein
MLRARQEDQLLPGPLEEKVERNEFSVAKRDDVIGRLSFITLEKGDSLPDIARHFSLGLNGVSAANPGGDIWAPEAGERIMLPLSFILPGNIRGTSHIYKTENMGSVTHFHLISPLIFPVDLTLLAPSRSHFARKIVRRTDVRPGTTTLYHYYYSINTRFQNEITALTSLLPGLRF